MLGEHNVGRTGHLGVAVAQLWMFWLTPIVGATVAAVTYGAIAKEAEPAAVRAAAAR
ncbi:MAG TPA: hypothetical protein VG498_02150 [Terriglobales bacterium]|nr:hypothetical protein [Terriglobales bacterium]